MTKVCSKIIDLRLSVKV